jgi:hypothetical protein
MMPEDLPSRLRAMVPRGRPFTGGERADATIIAIEAADEIDRLRAAQAWQPIETAPKDGAEVLGLDCGTPIICGWVAFSSERKARGIVNGWHDDEGEPRKLTHWMPLPPAPDAPA